ncbi:MAG TPA: hypothetical protein EYP10_09060, partial [Armatimonadetes bacterium]|nr:hypothetical protein [Armatimonadota bacterium]
MSSSKGGECIDKSGENARALAWGIAYCLAYDRGIGDEALKRLRQFIESDQMPQGVQGDEISIIAEVSRRLVLPEDDENGIPQTKEALKNCRLMQLCEWLNSPRIALIMGGATKIKQYVFESAKLSEIRGASGLLDRINLRDVPALSSREPHWLKELRNSADATEIKEAEQLVRQVREWFQACYGAEPPDCEECIIYANGGEVLAFAPLKLGDWLTEAIERLYTKETLIANSVAVWRPCSLMELRFGLRPLEFWMDDLNAVSDNALKELLSNYYGGLDKGSFLSKKNLGEVTAYLALEKLKRREGNLSNSRVPKPAPRFETKLYARRCQSCERRNAIVEGPLRTWLCEPCARKKVFGQKAKNESAERTRWFKEA